MKIKSLISLIIASVFFAGCSVKAPKYQADVDTMNNLSDISLAHVNISQNDNQLEKPNEIRLRGATMNSPYGSSFNEYLSSSLKEQLTHSKLYDEKSSLNINTTFTKNNVDIWGFDEGFYDLGAKFTIKKNEKVLLDKNIEVKHTFPSHFLGQIAIENAINNYPIAMSKLIAKFLNDKEVLDNLK